MAVSELFNDSGKRPGLYFAPTLPKLSAKTNKGSDMRSKILGLLAVGLLAGPMASNATNTEPYAYLQSINATVGVRVDGTLLAFDADGDALQFSIVQDPALGVVVLNDPFSGFFSYTPPSTPPPNIISGPDFSYFLDAFFFRAFDGTSYSNDGTVIIQVRVIPTVPEPGTLALLGLGLAGLGLSRRRKAN
jgi:hypothetical protein